MIDWVEQGQYDRLPVVLNLSAWLSPRQSLPTWIVAELHTKYQVPQAVGQAWVEAEQLCLLLDGLDEVAPERQAACVEAINHYHSHYAPEMVVCCREAEYGQLPKRLNFQAAVGLRPLTLDQVQRSLQTVPAAAGLQHLLTQDPTLGELAQSPLMLSLMVQSYQGLGAEAMPQGPVLVERQGQLLATYVHQMMQRQRFPWPRSQVLGYLHQLADYMGQGSQSIFLIELMQPTWLRSPLYRRLYAIGTKASLGMLWGGVSMLGCWRATAWPLTALMWP